MPVAPQQQGLGSNVRCVHYDRTGVCYFGELCTFDHSPVPEENALEVQRPKDKEGSDRAARVTQLLASRNEELNALRLRSAEMSRAKGIRAIERGGYGDSNPFLTHDLVALHSEAQRYYRRHGLNGMGTGGVGGFRRDVGKATRSSVVRLDNRPKRIIVAPIEAGSDEDATLRQYLQHFTGCKDIYAHPDRGYPNTLILTFAERFQGDIFQNEVASVLGIAPDKLLLFWIPDDMAVPTTSVEQESSEHDLGEKGVRVKEEKADVKMEGNDEESVSS